MGQTAETSPRDALPDKIGKYHVIGVAGRGNMGVVYTGYDPYSDRDVAIKVCRMDPAGGRENPGLTRKLFFNEAQTAGILDHPNILKVLDAGEEDGQLYLVAEYVEGGETLARHCDPGTLLPVKTVAGIVHTCALALDYAHRRGVVHRDIKPTNLLFTRDGLLKIGDFGIAQRQQADVTQVLGLVGSPSYMSPEQVREERLTGQSDLYSLGVVMYELLTGQLPFRADTLPQLVHRICHEEPPPVAALRPTVPAQIQAVVDRAMHKSTAGRYRSGRALAADLAALFTHLEAPAPAVPQEARMRLISALKFFADFAESELWEVLNASIWEQHRAGERIITEGATEMSFFIIVAGAVTVAKGGQALGTLGRGDCFGEMGYLAGTERSASIIADNDVSVMKINSTLMDRASPGCQLRFNKAFVKVLVERLSRTSADFTAHLRRCTERQAAG